MTLPVALWRRLALLLVAASLACAVPTVTYCQDAAVEEEAVEEATEEAATDEATEDTVVEGGPMQTIGVAALASYDNLMQDIRYVGALVGRPQGAEMIEGMIALFTQGRGLEGLDKSRPVGVVVQTDGQQFAPLVCLPIADVTPVFELLGGMGIEPTDLGDGVYEIQSPQQTIYAKNMGEWTYVAQKQEQLAAAPEDPSKVLGELSAQYDLGVRVLAQNVPPMFKALAVQQLNQGMQQGLNQEEGETDEDFAKRKAMAEQQIEMIQELIEGVDQFTIGLSVDESSKKAYADGSATFVPDSKFAKLVGHIGEAETKFGGFHQVEQSLTLIAASAMPPEVVQEFDAQNKAQVAMWREQVAREIDKSDDVPSDEAREALKSAVNDLLDAVEATQASGKSDIGGTLASTENGLTFVSGIYMLETGKVESALKTLDGALQKEHPDAPKIQWDAAEHAGAKFHTLSFPLPPEAAEAEPLLGKEVSISVGIAAEAVYIGFGPDHMAAMTKAIDDSASQSGKKVKPAELTISLRQVLAAVASVTPEENRKTLQMIVDSLAEGDAKDDHIRVTVEGIPNGARYRYEAEEGILRGIGQGISAAAMQAQQQQFEQQ